MGREVCIKYLTFALFCAAFAFADTPQAIQKRASELLTTTLKDGNPDTRKQAVIALSLVGEREPYVSHLIAMLKDPDVQVRLATIVSLDEMKTKRTIAALREAVHDDVPEVGFAAAKVLFQMGDPVGKQAMLSVLSGETKTSSGFLTKQKRDAMRMMHTPKAMFMFAVKTGVGFAPVPGLGEGIASMQALMSDPGVSGRATAALLLGKERDRETLEALKEALWDSEWSVRAAAVHSLAIRNDPALRGDFVPLLSDKKEAVRLRAAAAYIRLSELRATPPRHHPASKPAASSQGAAR